MATATLVRMRFNQSGERVALHTKYDAELLADGLTTISTTAGTDEHTVTDSGGSAFTSASVGDQLYFSGFSNDAVNGYFQVNAKASNGQITVEVRGDGAETNGATEAAGNAITISKVPEDTECVNGEITLSNGSTITITNTSPQHDDHEIHMFSTGKVFPPLCHASVEGDVTATASAGDAWTDGAGNESPALSSYSILDGNYSQRLDASARYDYDNHYICQNGIGDAPYGVGAAVDPSTDANLTEWWAPDLETGYTDGDNIATLVGQEGVKNLTPRSGGSYPWAWEESSIRGVAGVKMKDYSGQEWRSAWVGLDSLGNGSAKTIIAAVYLDDPEASFSAYSPISAGDTSRNMLRGRFDALTGVRVVAIRENGDGSATTWSNYGKEEWDTLASGQTRIMNAYKSGGLEANPRVGRIYEIGAAIADATYDTYCRYLLDFYDDADWAPQIHLSESGNDTTGDGSLASPMLSVQGASNRYFGNFMHEAADSGFPVYAPHFIVPEGEVVDVRLKGDLNTSRLNNGYSAQDWGCVRVLRSSSSPYPTFRTLGDGNGIQKLMNLSTDDGVYRKFAFIGACPREPRKIPTDSPLREAGDTAFSGAYTSQEHMIACVGSASDVNEFEVQLAWCTSVGGGLISSAAGAGNFNEAAGNMADFFRVGYAHAHGVGHTNPYYVSGPYTIFLGDEVTPSPGWEPINSVETDDTRSHNHYDQYGGSGSKVFFRSFSTDASSHYLQARTGGVSVESSMIVDTPIGVFVASGAAAIQNTLIEGGKDINTGPRGWGFDGTNIDAALSNVLMIPSAYTSSGFSIKVDNSDDKYASDVTAGPEDKPAFIDFLSHYRRINLNRVCCHERPGTAITLTDVANFTMTNSVIKAAGKPIDLNNTDAEVTAYNYNLTNNSFDIDDSSFAETEDGTRTKAQFEALCDTASGNVETAETYVDTTRSVRAYAQDYLDDGSATPLDLALEMIRQREAGTFDDELEIDYIRNWVFRGYETTSGRGVLAAPYLSSSTPADSATGILTSRTTVDLVFSDPVQAGTVSGSITGGGLPASLDTNDFQINAGDKTMVQLTVDLSAATSTQTITIDAGSFISLSTGLPNEEITITFTMQAAVVQSGNRSRERTGLRLR